MSNSAKTSGGLTIWSLLAVVLIGLKLACVGVVATWSWWWVLAPFWGPWALFAVGWVLYVLAEHYEK